MCTHPKPRAYISVMSHVVHQWVSQEWPCECTWQYHSAAGWQCFPVFMTLRWLSTLPEDNPWFQRIPGIGDKEGEKENESWGKWRVLHKWESESHLLFQEQNSNSEVRNEDRGRAVWKENNSQLLCWRMPWLQTDWAINRPIIYSLLIAFVKVSRVLSHRSPYHLVSLHVARKHVSVFLCVRVHGHAWVCESWLPACGVCVTWACQ